MYLALTATLTLTLTLFLLCFQPYKDQGALGKCCIILVIVVACFTCLPFFTISFSGVKKIKNLLHVSIFFSILWGWIEKKNLSFFFTILWGWIEEKKTAFLLHDLKKKSTSPLFVFFTISLGQVEILSPLSPLFMLLCDPLHFGIFQFDVGFM